MTWKLSDRVTVSMGAGKGQKGTVRELKRNETGYGDPFITEVYVEWDTGGFSWQWVSNLIKVDDEKEKN